LIRAQIAGLSRRTLIYGVNFCYSLKSTREPSLFSRLILSKKKDHGIYEVLVNFK
jgi:hypothetical protein